MKRIKLNFLVILLLLLILIFSSLALLFSSVVGFDKFKEFALNVSKLDIERSSEAVFTIDIDQQASMANTIFNAMSGYTRILSFQTFQSGNRNIHQKEMIKLSYEREKNTHTYFSYKNVIRENGHQFGFFITDFNSETKPKRDIKVDCGSIIGSLPLLKRICMSTDLIVSVWTMDNNGICLFYSSCIEDSYKSFNNTKINEVNDYFSKISKYEEKPYYSKIYNGFSGKAVLSLFYPIVDKQNKLIGMSGINVDFQVLLNLLYNNNLRSYYTKLNIIRLFINDKGYIMFCPHKYQEIFSLPQNDNLLIVQKGNLYNANMAGSNNPQIRQLLDNIIKNDSGMETVNIDDVNYLASYKAIPSNNWRMAVMVRTDDLYGTFDYIKDSFDKIFNSILLKYIIIFICITIVALLIGYLVFKK